MKLDFSKLTELGLLDFDAPEPTPEAPDAAETAEGTEIPALDLTALKTASTAPEEPKRAYMKLTREQRDRARQQEAYRGYQTNIRNAETLKTEILRGSGSGEEPAALLLKACKCISSMTGENLFCEQVERNLKTIYGEALLDPIPLEWELDEVRKRLDRLRQAMQEETRTEDRQRIARAIEANKVRAMRLEGLLGNAGERKRL